MGKFEVLKREDVFPDYENGPTNFICEGAAYFLGTTLCWVTLAVEYDGAGYLSLELECEGPPDRHWLTWEIDNVGLDEAIEFPGECWGEDDDAREQWLIRHGIAPGQRFRIAVSYWSDKHWTDYGYEYDAGCDWEIIAIEPWTTEHVLESWEAYFRWAGKRIHTVGVQDVAV